MMLAPTRCGGSTNRFSPKHQAVGSFCESDVGSNTCMHAIIAHQMGDPQISFGQTQQALSFVYASVSDFATSLNILHASKQEKAANSKQDKAARAIHRRGINE